MKITIYSFLIAFSPMFTICMDKPFDSDLPVSFEQFLDKNEDLTLSPLRDEELQFSTHSTSEHIPDLLGYQSPEIPAAASENPKIAALPDVASDPYLEFIDQLSDLEVDLPTSEILRASHSQPAFLNDPPAKAFEAVSTSQSPITAPPVTRKRKEPNSLKNKNYQKEAKPFPCAGCNLNNSNLDIIKFKRHILKDHTTLIPYVCTHAKCKFRTDIYNTMYKHTKNKHQKQYEVTLKTATQIRKAVNVHLKSLKWEYQCKICKALFPTSIAVQNHANSTAHNEKNVQANQSRGPELSDSDLEDNFESYFN